MEQGDGGGERVNLKKNKEQQNEREEQNKKWGD